MRVFDTADRQQWTKDTTFKREMFSHCNLWILEKVHAKTIAKYDALLDARRKAIKSAPRGAPASRRSCHRARLNQTFLPSLEKHCVPRMALGRNTVYLGWPWATSPTYRR